MEKTIFRCIILLTLAVIITINLTACDVTLFGGQGVVGPQGEKGDTGAQGPQGEKGDTGAQGPQGEKGDTGAQGPQGEKGDTGAQGPQGEVGRGILKVEIIDGNLWITYSDAPNNPVNVGAIQQETPITKHTFTEWFTIKEATCTIRGIEQRYCTECAYTESRTTNEASGHSYNSTVTPPTATEDGETLYVCSVCGDSYTLTVEPINFTITSDTRSLIGYTGAEDENLVIPPVFQNKDVWYKVVAIDSNAFLDCANLTSVTIPNTVISIGNDTFKNCKKLANITIPEGVTYIGDQAFMSCSSLKNVTIPNSITNLGDNLFYLCLNLVYNQYDNAYYIGNEQNPYMILMEASSTQITSCTIHEDTIFIESLAFSGCQKLESITIPQKVKVIGRQTFQYCKALTNIVIPDNVLSLRAFAFYNCTNLSKITLGSGLQDIGGEAFEYCAVLTNIVIPDNVTSIGSYAFRGCTNLTNVTIGNGVTDMGWATFYQCTNLESIIIPDKVTNIKGSLFYECTSLTSVTLPAGLVSVGQGAFAYCTSLTSITYKGTVSQWDTIKFDTYAKWNKDSPATEIICSNGIIALA